MFDGADLNSAYGTSLSSDAHHGMGMESGGGGSGGNGFLMASGSSGMNGGGHVVQLPPPPQSSATEEIVLPPPAPGATSHAMPPDVSYYPPNAMYARGGRGMNGGSAGNGDSMWDKLSSKKYDVLKLVVLSLVILLAMSSDRVVNFYLTKYINGGIFTTVQEFLVRLSYPLVVLVILWIIKASA